MQKLAMTHKQKILGYMKQIGTKSICDDCLSAQTHIKPRQTINQTCHQLAFEGPLNRNKDVTCDFCGAQNKIVNALPAQEKIAGTPVGPISPTPFELFKIALETRNLEIDLFWKRSNYFLVLNTAIAVGFFNKAENGNWYAIALALFGLTVSVLWFQVNCGGKFWQSRWEYQLKEAEDALEKQSDKKMNYFSAHINDIKEKVEKFIEDSHQKSHDNLFNKYILEKYSVSKSMIILSLIFASMWFTTLARSLYYILYNYILIL